MRTTRPSGASACGRPGAGRRSMLARRSSASASAAAKPAAQASNVYAATSCARAGAEASRAARGSSSQRAAARRASASASPAGTTSPLRSWRTRPPAAAPTASVAMTGDVLVHGFVDDQPPRLAEGRAWRSTVRPERPRPERLRTSVGSTAPSRRHQLRPRTAREGARVRATGQHERRVGAVQARRSPGLEQHLEALLGVRSRPTNSAWNGPSRRRGPGAVAPTSRCRRPAARRGRCARRGGARRRRRAAP